ncbi:uncharacterized protein BDR25DRAFT_326269 [Lindgomyces ingoldianus]|uniref:Uncharacterized protein n=1 Tax=Lindgomyces ingoldianus TaxID=673940 RepID=A0ACB6QRB2_9PLEO|nr:uncharacterized protein BDR25DRAFT_326269 [Lindgomyces ingoldianus]KAF2469471.1 hypothetical protein BDR25DRAFT_326269 [Lindgomyces ingoldianus]
MDIAIPPANYLSGIYPPRGQVDKISLSTACTPSERDRGLARVLDSVGHRVQASCELNVISTDDGVEEAKTATKNDTLLAQAPSYIRAILDPADTTFPRLECPFSNVGRYTYLNASSNSDTTRLPKYFFALDLHQCVQLLPRLIGSIVEAIRFLGPENCVLSIVEGRSDDGTFEVLKELRGDIEDRIEALALLRNLAVKDLVDNPANYSQDTTVIFSNDIAMCMEDILEIVHQRAIQGADMTCAMDWTYVSENPTFYDVWIARGMTGDSFFHIPEDGSWDLAWNLFWNDEKSRSRLMNLKPFQVFSCWNGMTAFTAKPLMEGQIKFRDHYPEECFQGEPNLFTKDMWYFGYGKIAVIPSVNVEYSDKAAKKIKALKGYASRHVAKEGDDARIEWETTPPAKVKCMPDFKRQEFVAWDEGLTHFGQESNYITRR